jgi:hypothetical protein
VRLPYRIVAHIGSLAVAATLGGCNNDLPPVELPVAKPAPAAPPQLVADPAPKDMKPAESKAPEVKPADGKTVDELPPLVPPAGGKDERPDAKPK